MFNDSHIQNPAIAFFSISIMRQTKQQAASADMKNLGFILLLVLFSLHSLVRFHTSQLSGFVFEWVTPVEALPSSGTLAVPRDSHPKLSLWLEFRNYI